MFVSCWSAKGGSGTTVVAAALSLLLGRVAPGGGLLVDLAGDAPAALGLGELTGPGARTWLGAEATPPDALARLEVPAVEGLHLLPAGSPSGPLRSERAALLASLLAADARAVVVDCGPLDSPAAITLAGRATISLLVLRPCYLALRRAQAAPIRPSGVVLVSEPGRALGRADVEAVLGVPVRAVVPWDPAVARCVDAGLLARRLPRLLERSLRRAA